MGRKNEAATVSWKSLGLEEESNLDVTACIIKFGMDWKQKIDTNCLSSITFTDKIASELRKILLKAGPEAEKELMRLAYKESNMIKKTFYTDKAKLVKAFIIEQYRLEDAYVKRHSDNTDPVSV